MVANMSHVKTVVTQWKNSVQPRVLLPDPAITERHQICGGVRAVEMREVTAVAQFWLFSKPAKKILCFVLMSTSLCSCVLTTNAHFLSFMSYLLVNCV